MKYTGLIMKIRELKHLLLKAVKMRHCSLIGWMRGNEIKAIKCVHDLFQPKVDYEGVGK